MRRSVTVATTRRRRALSLTGAALVLALAAAGCSTATTSSPTGSGVDPAASTAPSPKSVSAAVVSANIRTGAQGVGLGRTVKLDVAHGRFTTVSVSGSHGALDGAFSSDKSTWHSTGNLSPNESYTVSSMAVDQAGLHKAYRATFKTKALAKDEQTYPSFFPTGGTVGVAMPVIIRFDVAVSDKASIERHLKVTSSPAQVGAFHWVSDHEVHWRPRAYWKPGTKVTVAANIANVPAGKGIYGQLDRETSFDIGRSMVSKVDIATDQLRAYENGKLINTIPVTTGQQPEYTTRSGVKVIVEKDRRHDMNSETIGIDPNGPNGYNLKGVEFAMRLTYSGEFLHAAPWSVAQQGHANVSHGCTGMSRSNAEWLFNHSMVGDPVIYSGSNRAMTLTNGFGDWNESFSEYKAGSALS